METFKNGVLKISVRNLVEFVLRSGDIDNRTVSGADKDAMQEGARLHKKIQGKMGGNYHAEVPLRMEFPYTDFSITVEGRADGIIDGDDGKSAVIDEIKCVYADLYFIEEPRFVHKAQAMCYGYMYGIQNELEKIDIQMTYANLDTEEIKRLLNGLREFLNFITSGHSIFMTTVISCFLRQRNWNFPMSTGQGREMWLYLSTRQ